MESTRSSERLDVTVGGELDGATAVGLGDELDAAIAEGVVDVVIDCAQLRFIDSRGVGALLLRRNQLEERGGSMTLTRTNSVVRQSLSAMGLERVLNLDGVDPQP